MDAFADPQAVARYAENPPRLVPGYFDMQRMAAEDEALFCEAGFRDVRLFYMGFAFRGWVAHA